ncbi:MAG: glycosyltransferase family 39 protein [Anaerolineae bacterium]|nr:glycosyltransferase family 39 protein [Anaerolineae bacterium]
MMAYQLLNGHGFTVAEDWWPATPAGEPTAHWSYLYTLYLVAVYGIFGYQPLIARLLQAIIAGILTPWLTYRVGCRYFNTNVGLVSAALAAVYIYFVYYAGTLMTETFYIISILWILDITGKIAQTQKPEEMKIGVWGLTLGLAIALTVLFRQVFLLFLPFLFLWLLWIMYRRHVQLAIRMMAILTIATVVLVVSIAPWSVRNYRAFNTFVLLNTNAGFAFFWGNHPIQGYNFISILPDEGPSYQDLIPPELRSLNEAELDKALLKESWTFIQADPERYIILSISRVKDYFKFWPSSDSSAASNFSRVLSFGLLLPFMIYGIIRGLHHHIFSSNTLILYLFIVIYTGVHLLTWALIRYRLPVDAILMTFAGVAIVEIQAKLAPRYNKVSSELELSRR